MAIYHPPQRGEPTATFNLTRQTGLLTYFNMEVATIDNKSVGMQFPMSTFHIHPGLHVVTLNVQFRQGAWARENVAVVAVYADFKNNQNYHILGKVNHDRVLAWVTNQDGKTVSTIESATYTPVITQTVYISR